MAIKGEKPAAGGLKRVSRGKKKSGARKVTAKATFDLDEETAAAAATPTTTRAYIGGGLLSTGGIGRLRERDITDALRQLIMLLDAGTPLLKSLSTISERGERPRVRALLSDITSHVESGNALWQAFERHPRQFDPVFISLVKASEASGTLTTVLKRLIGYREKRDLLLRRMRGALWYPAILVVVCCLVLLLIAKVVVPQFQEIFAKLDLEAQLPWYTTTLINTVNFLSSGTVVITALVVIIALVVAYRILVMNPLWRVKADRWKMRIPKIGHSIIRKHAVVQFTNSLSLLLRSGLSMMVTLDLVRNVIHNKAMATALQGVRDSVERGEGIEEPLRQARGIFPPVVVDMLVTGEESGQLDSIAEHIAETYEEELNITIGTLGELLQPILTILIGLMVLVLFLALFVPMITMLDQLGASAGG